MPSAHRKPLSLEPGTLVGVVGVGGHAQGVHCGVVSDRLDEYGLPLVIAPSHTTGRVQEQAWLAFTEGKEASVFPAVDPKLLTLSRARAKIGQPVASVAACQQFAASLRGETSLAPVLVGAAIAAATVAVIAGAFMLLVNDTEDSATQRRPAASR